MTQVDTLVPCYLVSIKSTKRGNVNYQKTTLESDHLDENNATVARWEQKRTIRDKDEDERAKVARGAAVVRIKRVCSPTQFGYLCPLDQFEALQAGIAEADQIVRDFNRSAAITRIGVFSIIGKVAENDAQAIRAINSEMRDLIDEMRDGVDNLDTDKIRAAAKKAKAIGQMLSPEARDATKNAIEAARKIASAIVAKAGEQAAIKIDQKLVAELSKSRTVFLDLDAEQVEVAAPVNTGRSLDMNPDVAEVDATPSREAVAEEFDDTLPDPEPTQTRVAAPATRAPQFLFDI